MADLQGWSRGTWGEGEFGEFIPVSVTGVQSNTSVGTLTITANAVVQPTGVSSGVVLGTAIGEAESIYPLTGVQSNTATGTLEAQEGHGVQPTGVEASFNNLGFIYNLDSQTAGFPVLSNTESKTGTTSAYFGSTNNEIQIPQSQDVIQSALSANNQFTIEFWYYEETQTQFPRLISVQQSDSTSTRQFQISRSSNNDVIVVNQSGILIRSSSGVVSGQNWHHIAVTADNGTVKLYIDGVLEGTDTGVTFINALSEFNIGGTGPFGSDDTRFHLDGYMDLFRVSNNVRYTTTFTPPTTAFSVDSNTVVLFNFDGPDGSQDFELLSGTNPAPNIITSTDAGWGRSTWGSLAWGQNFVDAIAEPTGLQSNVALQNPTIIGDGSVTVSPAEDQMDTLLGTLTMSGSAVVLPTGLESSFNTGDAVVEASNLIEPTGVEALAETGTPTIVANANVDVTGNSINFTSGEVEVVASHIEEVTGQEIGTATGNVVIESAYTLTGELIQFTQGEEVIVANADVPVTGIEMSVVLGNMRSTPWANVVTGASNTWTEVAA